LKYLDMLTHLGIGSAHPGGFAFTLKMLDTIPLQPGSSILEVGCGTGRTACLLAQKGFQVYAVDLRPGMIEKAKKRSELQQVKVDFAVGDICRLPFGDNQFDLVLAESVTNFADASAAVSEYYRVLKPGGMLYDSEVIRLHDVTGGIKDELVEFLGIAQLLSAEEWGAILEAQGFTDIRLSVSPMEELSAQDDLNHPDEHQIVSEGAYIDASVWHTSLTYTDMMDQSRDFLGSAVLVGSKG
jgi:SAM-dependent methyltransferase